MIATSKARRIKTPIHTVRDKFEDITKPVQSDFPETILMRSEPEILEIPTEPTKIMEPVPEVKAKKNNAWIGFVKAHAEANNLKFRDALRDPSLKEGYKKFKENKV
jgi:hypothetical protein